MSLEPLNGGDVGVISQQNNPYGVRPSTEVARNIFPMRNNILQDSTPLSPTQHTTQKRNCMEMNKEVNNRPFLSTAEMRTVDRETNVKKSKQNSTSQLCRKELISKDGLEKVVDKIIEENPDHVRRFVRNQRKALMQYLLAGMVEKALEKNNHMPNHHMLDMMLEKKLEQAKQDAVKTTMQQDVANGGG